MNSVANVSIKGPFLLFVPLITNPLLNILGMNNCNNAQKHEVGVPLYARLSEHSPPRNERLCEYGIPSSACLPAYMYVREEVLFC